MTKVAMSNLAFVMERLQRGDKVRFLQDYYGGQHVELSRGWLLERKIRVPLSDEQIALVKAALHSRRDVSAAG
jgi:hypothetical protein